MDEKAMTHNAEVVELAFNDGNMFCLIGNCADAEDKTSCDSYEILAFGDSREEMRANS